MQPKRSCGKKQVLQPCPDADPLFLDRNDGMRWRQAGKDGDQARPCHRAVMCVLKGCRICVRICLARRLHEDLGKGGAMKCGDVDQLQEADHVRAVAIPQSVE